MSYYFSKTVQTTVEDAITRITNELQKEEFGVLTVIDVKATLKKKINVDFRNYFILGACNPSFALQALEAEDKIGTMLPCNIIVQEIPDVGAEIAAIDPAASMQIVGNPKLAAIATQVRNKLKDIIARVV